MDWPEAARKGELWAAGLNALALGALWLTREWWRADRGEAATPASRGKARWRDLVFFAGLTGIVIFAGTLRWKVAHHSLWWDEVWQARNASVGDWKPDKKNPGELKFVPTTWPQALWNYRKPTNHPPMAVASKLCHEVWRRTTGAKPGEFDEFVLRLPGFVASLVAVAMIALLLRAWGLPGGGLVSAFFLAIHPWHIRYGIDGRGYTFLVPLTILGIWAVWRACGPAGTGRRGGAVWWWVFGVTQGLILWCHLLSLWVCAGLAVAGFWWIWCENSGAERLRKLARFIAVQAVGAMLLLQLFAPNLLQAATWGEKNQDGRLLDGPYLLTTLTEIACGWEAWPKPTTPWRTPITDFLEPSFDMEQFFRECVAWDNYTLPRAALVEVGAFLCAGLLLTWKYRRDLFVAAASVVTSGALFLSLVAVMEFYFYHRFVLAVIVPVALLVGAAVGIGGGLFRRASAGLRVGLAMVTVVCLLFSWAYWNQIERMRLTLEKRPCSPLRETAAALRTARDEGAVVFGYGFGAEALQYYLPDLKYERDSPARPALEGGLRDARAAGKPLFVAVGYEELNRQKVPDGFALLDDPAVFEEDSERGGWEPQFTFRILRSVAPAALAAPR